MKDVAGNAIRMSCTLADGEEVEAVRVGTDAMADISVLKDVPWGAGVGNTAAFLKELHRLGIRPTMFGLEYSCNGLESMPDIAKCVAFFNQVSLGLASGGQS